MVWGTDQDVGLRSFYQRLIKQRKQRRERFWPAPISVSTGNPSVLVLLVGDGIRVAVNRSEDPESIELLVSLLNVAISTSGRVEIGEQAFMLPPMPHCLLLSG
ncbi:MAG: hypothetical protein M3440_02930 [Chloroflexota bacterium]|nr:hypothetical protein [Chloroflexota bacterium]